VCRANVKSYEYNIGLLESIMAQPLGKYYLVVARQHNETLKMTDPLNLEVIKSRADLVEATKNLEIWRAEYNKQRTIADKNRHAAEEGQTLRTQLDSQRGESALLSAQVRNLTMEKASLQRGVDNLREVAQGSQKIIGLVTEELVNMRLECLKNGVIDASELGVKMIMKTDVAKTKGTALTTVVVGSRTLGNRQFVEYTRELKGSPADIHFHSLFGSCSAAIRLQNAKPPISTDGRLCIARPEDFPDEDELRSSIVCIGDKPGVVAIRCDSWLASMLAHMSSKLDTEEIFDGHDDQQKQSNKLGKGSLYREYPK
jgi:hypothetical protein